MKNRAIILLLLLFLPLYGWSSTTRQVRDTLIMNNVKYAINQPPLGQLDSLHYCSLRDQVGFNEFFSWNFRGYVATWRVDGNKLYLDTLKTGSDKADFRDALKDFKDSRGNVFASWFSGTVICGTGPLLCASGIGWDDLNETEVELIIKSGVVTASRHYQNKRHKGTISRDLMLQELPKKFNHRDFPELKGFYLPYEMVRGRKSALRQRSKKSFCNSTVRHSVPMEGGSGTNGIMKGSIGLYFSKKSTLYQQLNKFTNI